MNPCVEHSLEIIATIIDMCRHLAHPNIALRRPCWNQINHFFPNLTQFDHLRYHFQSSSLKSHKEICYR